eukprot:926453-Amphidinium_carterae.1
MALRCNSSWGTCSKAFVRSTNKDAEAWPRPWAASCTSPASQPAYSHVRWSRPQWNGRECVVSH